MKNTNKTKNLALSGLFLALLVMVQFLTKSFGQLVTGSAVNLVLAMAAMKCSLPGSLVAGFVSPFIAYLLGIGPAFLPIVPCVALGNISFIVITHLLTGKSLSRSVLCTALAALVKAGLLYVLVVKLVVPSLGLPEAKAAVISAMFSVPQLVTALIGGGIAQVVKSRIDI